MKFAAVFASSFNGGSLPYVWFNWVMPSKKIGGLLAQVGILRGEAVEYRSDGSLAIGDRDLVGPAGKAYRFKTEESAAVWGGIARERALRELQLARQMDGIRRASWLAKKRSRLARDAELKILRAGEIDDADTRNALIEDAGFALVKWSHYG